MEDNQTSEDKTPYDPKAPRKQELTPPGKPEPSEGAIAVTPRGKDIKIGFDKRFGMYTVVFPDGGQVPKELSGKWTEEKRCRSAIDTYLANYWKNRT